MTARPQILGALVWPYQCADWDARTRLIRIRDHCSIVAEIGEPIDFAVDAQLQLLELDDIYEGLRVVVDQPEWFMREGQLVINLFVGTERVYSLAFSLSRRLDEIVALVGAIQGRDVEGALDLYRDLTKKLHGMRPRDFLIEVFGMLCEAIGAREVLAVSDESRHHRNRYFGREAKSFPTNYNEIWTDRGGIRVEPSWFRLRLNHKRGEDEIPPKKRAMYKRRYEMLGTLRGKLYDSCQHVRQQS